MAVVSVNRDSIPVLQQQPQPTQFRLSEETASGLIHMPDFLETSFDHPKTAKVPLNALIFSPVEIWLVQLRNAKTKILFRIHFFFAIFHFDPASRTASQVVQPPAVTKQKLTESFFRLIPTTFLPWAKPETACGTFQSSLREGYFYHISDFRPAICTWDLSVHMNPEPPQPKRPRIPHPYEKFPVQTRSQN